MNQTSVISGKPFIFVIFSVADPTESLTCARNSSVRTDPFQSQWYRVGDQAFSGVSVFLGNGPKVLQLSQLKMHAHGSPVA